MKGRAWSRLLQAVLPALANRGLHLFAITLLHSFPFEATSALNGDEIHFLDRALEFTGSTRLATAGCGLIQCGYCPGVDRLHQYDQDTCEEHLSKVECQFA